mmetsp:Transcript_33240/g.47180  ORF Transcript_33240/g.47180 Transcript_33240/m.47180 type:complete len:107 (+) Transcript_33240:74-394(+)
MHLPHTHTQSLFPQSSSSTSSSPTPPIMHNNLDFTVASVAVDKDPILPPVQQRGVSRGAVMRRGIGRVPLRIDRYDGFLLRDRDELKGVAAAAPELQDDDFSGHDC